MYIEKLVANDVVNYLEFVQKYEKQYGKIIGETIFGTVDGTGKSVSEVFGDMLGSQAHILGGRKKEKNGQGRWSNHVT